MTTKIEPMIAAAGLRRTTRRSGPPRIAMVGCGAIAEVYHLPALASDKSICDGLVLVDPDEERLRHLAGVFSVKRTATDYRALADEIDGAIVAAPPAAHAPIAIHLLKRGIHVLCEKPLAESSQDAAAMVAAAERASVTLSVNQTRRAFPANRHIHKLISDGALGRLRSITYTEGNEFDWPSVSGFYFQQDRPRGVLADKGAHSLDLICWWLGAEPELMQSQNDSFGGTETVANVVLQHRDCRITVRQSWLSRLSNDFCIVGQKGTIHGGIEEWGQVNLTASGSKTRRIPLRQRVRNYNDFGRLIVANFVDVVAGRASPLVPADEVLPSIRLIDRCYAQATRLPMPWFDILERLHVG